MYHIFTMSIGCTGFIQIAITVLANLMDYHSDKGGQVKRFFSIEEVLMYVILVLKIFVII